MLGTQQMVKYVSGRGRSIGLSLAIVLVAAACSSPTGAPAASLPATPAGHSAAAATAAPSQQPTTLTVVVPSNVMYSPLYVGVDKGIFLKHGIDLKISVLSSGPQALNGLHGGQFQFATLAWATAVPAAAQGFAMKLFCPVVGQQGVSAFDQQLALIARPGLSVKSVKDLKGLKLGSSPGAVTDWAKLVYEKAGLDPATDMKLINVSFPNALSAIQSGAADVTAVPEPYGTLILDTVKGSTLVARDGQETDVRPFITAEAGWFSKNPDLVDRMIAAYLESSQYVRMHPEDAAVASSHYIPGIATSILVDSIRVLHFDPRWSSGIETALDNETQMLLKNGEIKTAPKTTDILALNVLDTIGQKYPQYFTDLK
ncbi:MAG: ABC transporter substrate-binding protein [Chloroflexota bacterium]|nr:ABC transporter substrate-binding protein [Chloroflexota bacterium]